MILTDKNGKKYKPTSAQEAEETYSAVINAPFIVKDVKKGVSKAHALPPFTTSTMQQDASAN